MDASTATTTPTTTLHKQAAELCTKSPSLPDSAKVIIIAILFFVLHALPMLWIIHCCVVLLWLFPLSDSLALNILFLLIGLLIFIASGVNLQDYYFRRAIAVSFISITVHHFFLGNFDPLISWKNLLYIVWIVLPTRSYFSGNVFQVDRVAHWYLRLPFWDWMVESYFPITLIHDDETQAPLTEKDRKYFFVYHPHGLWPWGLWLSLVTGWKKLFPHVTWRVLTATPLLMLPYLGDYIQSIGGISADYKTCAKAVEAGHSLVVLPGGLAEAMLSDPTNYAILLKPRRGFIKLAIMHGLSLVPVFGFGETKLYHQISSWRELRMQLSRKTGFPITLFAGAYGTTVPRRSPIKVVVGKALHVTQKNDPTPEEVDAVFKLYEAALLELYNKYKPPEASELTLF